jgi:hypothetical protein
MNAISLAADDDFIAIRGRLGGSGLIDGNYASFAHQALKRGHIFNDFTARVNSRLYR